MVARSMVAKCSVPLKVESHGSNPLNAREIGRDEKKVVSPVLTSKLSILLV